MLKKLIVIGLLANTLFTANCVFAECDDASGKKIQSNDVKLKDNELCCCVIDKIATSTDPNGKCYSCAPTSPDTTTDGKKLCPIDPSDPNKKIRQTRISGANNNCSSELEVIRKSK